MRLLPILLITFSVIISIAAVGALLAYFGYGVDAWYGPLGVMHMVYGDLQENAFGAFARMVDNRFGIQIPGLLAHVAALYLCAALAFVSGTTGMAKRERIAETVKATALGAVVPLAIPLFIWQAIRIGAVSRFARENTLSFFGYIALVVVGYAAAVWANGAIYAPGPGEEAQVRSVDAGNRSAPGGETTRDLVAVIENVFSGEPLEEPTRTVETQQAPATAGAGQPVAQSAPPAPSQTAEPGHADSVRVTEGNAYALGSQLGAALQEASAEGALEDDREDERQDERMDERQDGRQDDRMDVPAQGGGKVENDVAPNTAS